MARNARGAAGFAIAVMLVFAAGAANAIPAGTVSGIDINGAKCMDRGTNRTYFDWATRNGVWDCADGGMVLAPGDPFFIKLIGYLNDDLPLGVEVTSEDNVTAIGCRNLNTGQAIFHVLRPGEEGFFDCEVLRPMGEPGDEFLIQVRGSAPNP